MLEQGQVSAGNQIRCGLIACNHKKDNHGQQLILTQFVARLLGLDQRRNQVVERLCAALPEQIANVTYGQPSRRQGAQEIEAGGGGNSSPRPGMEPETVLLGNPKQLADDRERERQGVSADNLHPPVVCGSIEQLVTRALIRSRSRSIRRGVKALCTKV